MFIELETLLDREVTIPSEIGQILEESHTLELLVASFEGLIDDSRQSESWNIPRLHPLITRLIHLCC